MGKLEIFITLMLLYIVPSLCENQSTVLKSRIDNLQPSPYQHTLYSPPATEAPSLVSKFVSWIFPFGGEPQKLPEPVKAERRYLQQPQYIPSAQQNFHSHNNHEPCNSCNNEPWIPVVGHHAQKTIVGFVPPSIGGAPFPPPTNQYGAPPPNSFYGAPPINHYGVPPNLYGLPPSPGLHGVPPVPTGFAGPPPPAKFGSPYVPNGSPQDQHVYDTNIAPHIGPPPPPVPHFMPPQPQKYKPYKFHQQKHHPQKYKPQHGQTIPLKPLLFPPPPSFNKYQGVPLNLPTKNVDYIQPPLPNYHLVNKPYLFPTSNQPTQLNPQNNGGPVKGDSAHDIQIIPSIRVADFVASIEHPINVYQSPVVDVITNEAKSTDFDKGLNDNPIIVDDAHVSAATAHNGSYINANSFDQQFSTLVPGTTNILDTNNQPLFDIIHPSLQPAYSEFPPSANSLFSGSNEFTKTLLAFQTPGGSTQASPANNHSLYFETPHWPTSLSTSMVPPPVGEPVWSASTTKKPKHLQIIIPYTSNNPAPLPQLPLYTQPPSFEESVWTLYDHKQEGSNKVAVAVSTQRPSTLVQNIRDLLANERVKPLPFDVTSLQNNIDNWTQREYHKGFTSGRFIPSKEIPKAYLTTPALDEVTTRSSLDVFDHEPAGSNNGVTLVVDGNDDASNFVVNASTPSTTVASSTKKLWDKLEVSISPLTKEKVYVVTPQTPRVTTKEVGERISPTTLPPPSVRTTPNKFSMVFKPEDINKIVSKNNISNEQLHIIFSEWPHLINNLMTTQKTKGAKHPLFGLMGLSPHTPLSNSTIQTFLGHSKVFTTAAQSTTPKGLTTNKEVENNQDTANIV